MRCPISVALVLDASGSMTGNGNAGTKNVANAFVQLMDGMIDEATILWFSSSVSVRLGMTSNLTALRDAINALPSIGGSQTWDGIYRGLEELINSGNNPCRAVIVMTDGTDVGSMHTPQDIISLANRNRIRVFTVGLGNAQPAQLETIALLTGGKYYQEPSGSQIVTIYEEMTSILIGGPFYECLITYQAHCMDGTVRTVDLSLVDYCDGSDTKTKTYRAPRDTSTFEVITFEIAKEYALPGTVVNVPVEVNPLSTSLRDLKRSTARIAYDPQCMQYQRIDTPDGTLLEGIPMHVSDSAGHITIETLDEVQYAGSDTLFNLVFWTVSQGDTGSCDIEFESWAFHEGCCKSWLVDGSVSVVNKLTPRIMVYGDTAFCEGGQVVLECSPGFTDHIWSDSVAGAVNTVTEPGIYWVEVRDTSGAILVSDTVVVQVLRLPTPSIDLAGIVTVCADEVVRISAEEGYRRYRWSNGHTNRILDAYSPEVLYVEVQNDAGCWGRSDSVEIRHTPLPDATIAGPSSVCDYTRSYEYSAEQSGNCSYSWHVTGGVITGADSLSNVSVRWEYRVGSISLTVKDTVSGCESFSQLAVAVSILVGETDPLGQVFICPGDTVGLRIVDLYDSYHWNTGDTTKSIRVHEPGKYSCVLQQDSCAGTTQQIIVAWLDSASLDLTGPSAACLYGTTTYLASDLTGATLFWTVEGGVVQSGQGTPMVNVAWDQPGAGRVRFTIQTQNCNVSASIEVGIQQVAKPEIRIIGDTILCANDTTYLEVSEEFNHYNWSNKSTSRQIRVRESGQYHVTVFDSYGCRAYSDTITITVLPAPPQPVITKSGDDLICDAVGMLYQWFKDGEEISGATERSLEIDGNANYSVTITDANGCTAESDVFAVTGTGQFAPGLVKSFTITPNPSNGVFTVALEFESPTAFDIRIVDITGREVYSKRITNSVVSYRDQVSLRGIPPGVYFFLVESGGRFDRMKFVVQGK